MSSRKSLHSIGRSTIASFSPLDLPKMPTPINQFEAEKLETQHRLPGNSTAIERVRVMCDLFNLAFEMKSLELERRYPEASKDWIKQETLRLIEKGTK